MLENNISKQPNSQNIPMYNKPHLKLRPKIGYLFLELSTLAIG